jgi:hypothetical protein
MHRASVTGEDRSIIFGSGGPAEQRPAEAERYRNL